MSRKNTPGHLTKAGLATAEEERWRGSFEMEAIKQLQHLLDLPGHTLGSSILKRSVVSNKEAKTRKKFENYKLNNIMKSAFSKSHVSKVRKMEKKENGIKEEKMTEGKVNKVEVKIIS